MPHWKTREQQIVSRHAFADYQFWPKEKDSTGKWIIVRADLEDHIARFLLQHISSERTAAEQFCTAPLFHRLYTWTGIAVVLLGLSRHPGPYVRASSAASPTATCLRAISGPAVTAFIVGYSTYMLLALMQPLLWRIYRYRHATPTPNQGDFRFLNAE